MPSSQPVEPSRASGIGAIIAASSGNLVEWFDFYVYAFCSVYFAPLFFPKADATGQLLNTAGVFAAGFLMRPIGGWVFGRLADRRGRRAALVASVLTMCVGSMVIALLPTYATIGVWAPGLLMLARLVQGFALGGEYGTAATYMSEVATEGRRGFLSSFQYVTLIGGQLAASLVVVILQHSLPEAALQEWGWRVPFILGALAALAALAARMRLRETTSAHDRQDSEAGSLIALLRQHPAAFLSVLGFTAGGSLIFYTFTTYMQKFLVNSAGMAIGAASEVMTVCLFIFMCLQPVMGGLSDRIGRRANMLIFAIGGAVMTVPLVGALHRADGPFQAGVLITLALVVISFYTSISGIIKAELFPTQVRALGVGFAYALANAIFGGTAEYAALFAKSIGHEGAFYWYVSAMMVMVFFVSWRLPRRAPYLGEAA
ncbi:MFS family transporter [Novosphingobium sediminicola]|uniref:Alpha-ketoglutarate permease n=1 Tax=Novosphingobium sediminicola TaxID=563162 RepID=A0A7W6G506_9SPHN|nr:MHS family alpha-ketoglutarate permease-like MFS transporter [Novosphingobium sediminicola]